MKPHQCLSAFLVVACMVGFAGCQSTRQSEPSPRPHLPINERQHYELTTEQRDQQYQRQENQNSVEGYKTK